jgi:F0F1-type ATP synthase assembly protein I
VAGHAGGVGDARAAGDRWAERRSLNNAFGEALAYAFEFAATAALFAGLGWLLDRWLGTEPVLMVTLAAFGFVGVCLRTVYRYKEKVELEEEGKPWTRRRR